jgi:hypothetical protein
MESWLTYLPQEERLTASDILLMERVADLDSRGSSPPRASDDLCKAAVSSVVLDRHIRTANFSRLRLVEDSHVRKGVDAISIQSESSSRLKYPFGGCPWLSLGLVSCQVV